MISARRRTTSPGEGARKTAEETATQRTPVAAIWGALSGVMPPMAARGEVAGAREQLGIGEGFLAELDAEAVFAEVFAGGEDGVEGLFPRGGAEGFGEEDVDAHVGEAFGGVGGACRREEGLFERV